MSTKLNQQDQQFTLELKARAIRRAQDRRKALKRDLDAEFSKNKVRKATKSKSCTLGGTLTTKEIALHMEEWS